MPHAIPDPRPALHPAYVRPLLGLLARTGVDPQPLLQLAGLSPADLRASESLLRAGQVEGLLLSMLQHVDPDQLAADYAALMPVLGHGPLALAAASSATLGDALQCIARYLPQRAPLLHVELMHAGAALQVQLRVRLSAPVAQRFVLRAALAMLQRVLQGLTPLDLGAARVQWTASPPGLVWCWPQALVQAPSLGADPHTLAQALAACAQVSRQLHAAPMLTPTPDALVAALRACLHTCEGDWPDAASAARQLQMSVRSLHRHLAAAGQTWRGLLDAARADRARHWLTTTVWPVAEIATRLGYADASNFSRSMRRWWGCTAEVLRAGQTPVAG